MIALKHGAVACVGVDSLQHAVNSAVRNAELNGLLNTTNTTFVKDDAARWLREAHARNFKDEEEEQYYDVVVLDPPKLALSASGLERASRKYKALNRDAMKLLFPKNGGLLLTCTCSGAMTKKDGGQYFLRTVKSASHLARRRITLLQTSGAAACHTQCPASFPARAYLTAALFHVGPLES